MPISREKKVAYFARLEKMLEDYGRVFIVSADNVGSAQMAKIRMSMRGDAEVVFGKNTLMRKAFSNFLARNPGHNFEKIVKLIRGNIGFVFTNKDLGDVRTKILSNKVPAPARVGALAPIDVWVEPGPTGCDPGQTSFFQALGISTKINKGQVEMISRVHLIHAGDRVTPGQNALLGKLSIMPFSYGLKVEWVYDNGSLFEPKVLDLSHSDIFNRFMAGARTLAAVSLALHYPTLASIPYSLRSAFSNLAAISLATDYTFKQTKQMKAYLADPSAFAAAAPAAASGGAAPAKAAEPESEEESDADMGGAGGLFGDDDDDDDDDE